MQMDYFYYNILLTGFILLFLALKIFRKRIRFLHEGHITTARVVHIEVIVVEEDGYDNKKYIPTFRYTTATNENYTYEYPISSKASDRWTVGDTIQLVYNTNNPREAILLTYEHAFGSAAILLSVAVLLIIAGGGYCLAQYFINWLITGI